MSARTILKHLHQQGRMTDYQFDVINRNLRERPQGHWIKHISNIECSNCGEKFYCEEDENCQDYEPCNDFLFNYCPNCGAKMKKETENEI